MRNPDVILAVQTPNVHSPNLSQALTASQGQETLDVANLMQNLSVIQALMTCVALNPPLLPH